MPRNGFIDLPPSSLDRAISKRCARMATPARENSLQVMTWLADEKVLLGLVGVFWMSVQIQSSRPDLRREANRMLLGVALAGLLPDVFKRLVNRKRPDRTVVHGLRHGIPRSGDPWDSFPSGHALHLGAIAGPLMRLVSPRARLLIGAGLLGVASTRILLLAHYTSDVAAGLAIGAGLGTIVHKLTEGR
jgi:undecaprenyl-diphosphatase